MNQVATKEFWDVLAELGFHFDQEMKDRYAHERDKRMRKEGGAQYVPTIDGKFADFGKDPWAKPGFAREPIVEHCDVALWLDRGHVALFGDPETVTSAYHRGSLEASAHASERLS